jgi:hypothetical protein
MAVAEVTSRFPPTIQCKPVAAQGCLQRAAQFGFRLEVWTVASPVSLAGDRFKRRVAINRRRGTSPR